MPRETMAQKRERAAEVERRMFEVYGEGACSLDYTDPFRLTVAVVLSAQCTDAAVNKVTPLLWERFPEPADLAAADTAQIEEIIRPLGFYRAKAAKLKGLAQMSVSEFGGTVPQDIDELQRLPGVGRKTANCVMCQAFRDPQGIAVDTHVYRIAHRLKFCGPSANTPDKVEAALLKVYPREQWLYINHQWVHFGREYCRARNPRCSECFVADICPSAGKC
ncbi:endonuclease III [Coriobacteriaceae bacterium]|uniref:Endonuclease III n=1 Tax=Granulimonas faecalis TaxID=2894155 RepID=A0AAV5B464_9ACTN|nr:endonuclease III [Granulimonas faecalis]TGY60516.1 endonuclease III [Coriobacteriaceae bacterium]GJM55591.1 endonuclease III [Granulimonas faecalis]